MAWDPARAIGPDDDLQALDIHQLLIDMYRERSRIANGDNQSQETNANPGNNAYWQLTPVGVGEDLHTTQVFRIDPWTLQNPSGYQALRSMKYFQEMVTRLLASFVDYGDLKSQPDGFVFQETPSSLYTPPKPVDPSGWFPNLDMDRARRLTGLPKTLTYDSTQWNQDGAPITPSPWNDNKGFRKRRPRMISHDHALGDENHNPAMAGQRAVITWTVYHGNIPVFQQLVPNLTPQQIVEGGLGLIYRCVAPGYWVKDPLGGPPDVVDNTMPPPNWCYGSGFDRDDLWGWWLFEELRRLMNACRWTGIGASVVRHAKWGESPSPPTATTRDAARVQAQDAWTAAMLLTGGTVGNVTTILPFWATYASSLATERQARYQYPGQPDHFSAGLYSSSQDITLVPRSKTIAYSWEGYGLGYRQYYLVPASDQNEYDANGTPYENLVVRMIASGGPVTGDTSSPRLGDVDNMPHWPAGDPDMSGYDPSFGVGYNAGIARGYSAYGRAAYGLIGILAKWDVPGGLQYLGPG